MIARNHDQTLHSRVIDYRPEYLDQLLYRDWLFFDSGGTIFIDPLAELPYWRIVMQRKGRGPPDLRNPAQALGLRQSARGVGP